VIGGFLVAGAAVVVFATVLAGSGSHDRSYVVAAQPLAGGSAIVAGDLTTEGFGLPVAARALAFRDSGALVGRTLLVAVQPGELIQSSMLAPTSSRPSLRPVSIAVDPTSLSGLSPGQTVDVLAAPATSASSSASLAVSVVMRGAALVTIDRSGGSGLLSGASSPSSGGTLVTLGVTDLSEVEAIVEAAHNGTVTLVQAEPADGVGAGAGGTSSVP
jgi:Flp pilus assembly protein CpaB